MLDTGYWIMDDGYWMLDVGCWMLTLILDTGTLRLRWRPTFCIAEVGAFGAGPAPILLNAMLTVCAFPISRFSL